MPSNFTTSSGTSGVWLVKSEPQTSRLHTCKQKKGPAYTYKQKKKRAYGLQRVKGKPQTQTTNGEWKHLLSRHLARQMFIQDRFLLVFYLFSQVLQVGRKETINQKHFKLSYLVDRHCKLYGHELTPWRTEELNEGTYIREKKNKPEPGQGVKCYCLLQSGVFGKISNCGFWQDYRKEF